MIGGGEECFGGSREEIDVGEAFREFREKETEVRLCITIRGAVFEGSCGGKIGCRGNC